MALLDDIHGRLTAAGVIGGASGWTGYKSYLPDTPDKAVAIYETGGPPPETALAIAYPTFQCRVRGEASGYAAARAQAQAVVDALHAQAAAVGAAYVYLYAANSGVLPLGNDENDRPHLTVNFRSMRSTA